ncbi:hypothetical protein J416_09514 [Gracilibacillus halophilus YIM-C55.5]|uniref:Uncharacterized protein n=1 Tax=Gracilibacillus halophilus YIM-C55.5 TaxID=1308866 RepID=N4WQJ1_9BACI|nr:hypothetical protein [Gracilibacillus halophilus]ENH96725.1 hypothetical protein J416_09514 [Gracilibacillus halophilus YIM-C55.5]
MKFILCQPAIKRFEWELEVCITRLQKLGIQEIILLFTQQDDRVPKFLHEKYGVEVHVYQDDRNDKTYIPSVKPYLWMRYLEEDSSREDESYFYLDSDVLLREVPNVKPTKNKWIASACESYLSIDYIDSKGTDLLDRMCDVIGVEASVIREHYPIGGAQWAIKNPTYEYWQKVYEDSINLYQFLDSVESEYIRRHDSNYTPIQKWTAEMWAQLWNVYHFRKQVEVPEELNFCWPTDPIDKYYQTKIYHNAGVMNDHQRLFFKGKYVNKTPFNDSFKHVDERKASIKYVEAIKEVKELAKYEVIEGFHDLEDNKDYFEGDRFPKPANKKVSQERLDELSSSDNKAGRPLMKQSE